MEFGGGLFMHVSAMRTGMEFWDGACAIITGMGFGGGWIITRDGTR